MKITLCNKDIPTAKFVADKVTGHIADEIQLINPEYLPVCVRYSDDKRRALQQWLDSRSIPAGRKNISAVLAFYKVDTPAALSIRNFGLNLSDQYWFKPENFTGTWDDVNLFKHDFVKQDFSLYPESVSLTKYSPDSSSNGELSKFWCVIDSKRYLYKEGSAPYYQQPYNEVLASELLKKMHINHVAYDLVTAGYKTYSRCETFITPDSEYVSAGNILGVCRKNNNENSYQHFWRCVHELNIPIKTTDIETMLLFDYLINNADRHFGNFGFIRNVNNLQFTGMAPIFDNGNSLWYMDLNQNMKLSRQPAKPFRDTHERQLKLLTAPKLPLDLLTDDFLADVVNNIYSQNELFDHDRILRLLSNIISNRDYLLGINKH